MKSVFIIVVTLGILGTTTVLTQPSRTYRQALFLGNSLTLHPPNPSIDWQGNWGMAASVRDKDFVHLVVSSLQKTQADSLRFSVAARPAFERDFMNTDVSTFLEFTDSLDADLIVIQLGDNVIPDSAIAHDFQRSYSALLQSLKDKFPEAEILTLTTFWSKTVVDSMIISASRTVGVENRAIGWIGADTLNRASSERSFTNAGVGFHPGDRGMDLIAATIVDALVTGGGEEWGRGAGEISRLDVYPNPFNGAARLRITLPDRQEVAFTLYNVLGQQILARNLGILNGGIHDLPFAVPHLSSGTYWLRVQAGRIPLHTAVLLMK